MKHFLNAIALIVSVNVVAQNNVGIGTTSPQAPLHINSGAANEALRIQGNNFPLLSFYNNSGLLSTFWNNGSNLDISTPLASGRGITFSPQGSQAVNFDYNGNVGIGTASPQSKLHIAGTTGDQLLIESAGDPQMSFYSAGALHSQLVGNSGSLDFYSYFTAAKGFRFFPGTSQPSLNIATNGNIGIGTGNTTPVAKLTVNGSLRLTGIGEALNRVLVSDASGNATWKDVNTVIYPLLNKTDTIYFSGMEFKSQTFYGIEGSQEYQPSYGGVIGYKMPNASSSNFEMFAPVKLPQGAVVTAMRVRYTDGSTSAALLTKLVKVDPAFVTAPVVLYHLSSGVANVFNGSGGVNAIFLNNATIDNHNYAYYLASGPTDNTGNYQQPGVYWDYLYLIGVEIIYTYPR